MWIGDSSKVKTSIIENDTSYIVKGFSQYIGTCVIYYDFALNLKARSIARKENQFIDTCWYNDGNIKSWSSSSNPECRNEKAWYRNRQLRYSSQCDGDTNIYLEYYSSGQLKIKNLTYSDSTTGKGNSFAWHYTEEYYENGELKFLPMDPNSLELQQQVRFYESGAKMDSVGWQNGTRVGTMK